MIGKLTGFLNRHAWIYVVLAFLILIGAWFTIISLAVKHGPEEIEVKRESRGN
jgi:uncharacterized membrane protein YdbT with pleckstrin-like domain